MNADSLNEIAIPHRSSGMFVTLFDRQQPHDDALVMFGIRAEAYGLSVSIGIETLYGDGLDAFIQTLDNDFRGWSGDRTWTSMHGDLEIRARHLGRFVRLSWTLRFPEPAEQTPDWETTIHIYVNPGEELRDVSNRIAAFLRG